MLSTLLLLAVTTGSTAGLVHLGIDLQSAFGLSLCVAIALKFFS